MRIGTLLKTSVSVAMLMVLGLGVANWRIAAHLNKDLLTRDRAQVTERNISKLLVLTHEYAQYSEQRALHQWQVTQNNIVENLEASAGDRVSAPKEALQEVKRLSGLFDQLDAARSSNPDIQYRQRNLLLDQLQGSSQVLADLVSRWRASIDQRLQETEQNFRQLILLIPVLMLLILIFLALILKRRVLHPLTQLNKAVSAVAQGDMTVHSATAHKDEFGELSRTFDAMAIDLVIEMKNEIAARKQVEQALTSSERFLNAIIDTEPECIKMLDIDSNLLMMNPAGLAMIEADSFEQLKGHCVCSLITPPYQDAFTSLIKKVFQGDPGKLEFEIIGIKGRKVWLETHAVPFRDEQGKIVAALGITRDITARKQAEAENRILVHQMQHAQRLESLGVLSGGIAHDFNNILAIIVGYCGLIKVNHNSCEKNIPKIEEAAERAAALCRQMLTYAGEAQLTKAPLNIGMIVDEMVTMLKSTLAKRVVIEPALSAKTPFIMADEGQIRQIVMNLITNAAEAVDEKRAEIDKDQGRIDKEQGEIDKDQDEIKVSLVKAVVMEDQPEKDYIGEAIPPGEYACLEVADNGCGMDEETKWRIFEPFYTTKFTGRGLGMSAVLGIIKSHDGALQLFSKPGSGTTFKVYLPVLEKEIGRDQRR